MAEDNEYWLIEIHEALVKQNELLTKMLAKLNDIDEQTGWVVAGVSGIESNTA